VISRAHSALFSWVLNTHSFQTIELLREMFSVNSSPYGVCVPYSDNAVF